MTDTLETGRELTVDIDSLAHGGEGVARADGLVIFVAGAVPGDTARVQLDDVKKRFARAQLLEILTPSPDRVPTRCPAAAAGAGCCNLSMVTPEAELKFKEQILRDQLQRIGRVEQLPEIEVIDLKPHAGWRTRFRLGVNDQGKAGFRVTGGNDIVVGKQCAQAPAGVLDEVLAGTYPAGAEIVVARDSEGHVAVVESRKAARGRSVTRRVRQLSGPEVLRQRVRETTFELDPLGFWQAHE